MTEVLFQVKAGVSKAWVCRVVEKALRSEKAKKTISVLITDDRRIRKINRRFLQHDRATDVISFSTGDIVVSAETARRVAAERGIPFREELSRYLVHGTLHLLGYDDKKKKDFKRMHHRQEKILVSLRGTK